jgi:S1-C subfamily serine protease
VGNPNALFEDPSEWKAQLLVAGLITDLKLNICYPLAGFRNLVDAKGEAYMKINWQVYSRIDRKVVHEVTTEGSYKTTETTPDKGAIIWQNAFATAARNLLSDKGFYDLVVGTPITTNETVLDKVAIRKIALFTTPVVEHINDVRMGVATVFAGNGHGSGFFITTNGFLLTNYHVVREAKFVKVKLATGREILGEVLRSNSKRDVALIKVEEGQMAPLPILDKDISIGEDVYAIGSPLDETLQSTISKGIISSYRNIDENKYLQSDVNILPGNSGGPLIDNKGNVVGITASALTFSGAPSGLNFFIPIKEALLALQMEQN